MTRQEAIKHKDAIVAFAEGKPIEMRGPGGLTWHQTPHPEFLEDWEYREAQTIYAINVEEMITQCIPSAEPYAQLVADSIRAYCRKEAL